MKSFEEIWKGRPDQKGVGSSGYSNLKNLYDICMRLKPQLVVESGTWKGNSSWLFSHWDDVWCYDIDFSNLMWRSDEIRYINCDIEEEEISAFDGGDDWSDTLFFFDDHISQLQRLKWLIKIGARYAVFDDNYTSEEIKNGCRGRQIKNPPSPTLEQMRESSDPLFGKIKKYEVLPWHGGTGFGRLTYIEL